MTTSRQYLITKPLKIDHNIDWYTIPKRPPVRFQHRLSKRKNFWLKQARVLNMVAQGYSLEAEIKPIIAQKAKASTKSVYRAIRSLEENGLLSRHIFTLTIAPSWGSRDINYAQVRLNRRGRGLCRCLATHVDERWRPYETGWERMKRLHEKGKKETYHTMGTLIFAYQARRRGWKAGVMPGFQEGRFVPDAVIEKKGKRFYVEIEFRYGKTAKWRNMNNALGYMAFCGRSPHHEQTLLRECGDVGGLIFSTNLTDLVIGKGMQWDEGWI